MMGIEALRGFEKVELIGEGDMRRGEMSKKSEAAEITSDCGGVAPMAVLSRDMVAPTEAISHNMVRSFTTL